MKKLSILLIVALITCLTLTAFATGTGIKDVFEEGSIGKWVYDTKIDPIDDTTMIAFGLECEGTTSRSPVLLLKWDDGKTQLAISWNNYLSDNTRVTHRFDKEKAVTKTWNGSTDKTATFYPGGSKTVIKFIQKLMEADKLAVQITPYNEGPTTAVFDIRGLKNAVEQFNDTLDWIKEYKYAASKKSEVFHYTTCPYVTSIKPENLILFKTREEAIASGRRPCKKCEP